MRDEGAHATRLYMDCAKKSLSTERAVSSHLPHSIITPEHFC